MKREGSPEHKRKDQVIEVDHQPATAHQLRRLDQLGQFPTRIKHARLHGCLADASMKLDGPRTAGARGQAGGRLFRGPRRGATVTVWRWP